MTTSFASLIVAAVLLLVRSTAVPLPAPLRALSHSLTGVHGYRTVMTVTTSIGTRAVSTVRTDTVFLSKGGSETSYAAVTVTSQGHTSRSEYLNTATRSCIRQGGKGPWACQRVTTGATTATGTALARTFKRLSSDYRWSAAGTSTVAGQQAVGYRAVSAARSGAQVTATLWLASKTGLPLDLHATTRTNGKAGAASETEVVEWSRWNDPSLTVPRV